MAATVYTAKHENFLYTNNSGGNARIIINGCYIRKKGGYGASSRGVIQWGDFLDVNRGTSSEAANPNNPYKSFDFLDRGPWGRNTNKSDLTYFYHDQGSASSTTSIPGTAYGVPCEYYIADGERFSLYHPDTDTPDHDRGGIQWYNIVVITDTAGIVKNGQGDFNYTNNTGETVRVIMAFLNHDTPRGIRQAVSGGYRGRRADILWGSSTDTQAGWTVSLMTQTGMGKWCLYNNVLNGMGEYITGTGRFSGPIEYWLSPGDYLTIATQGTGHNSSMDSYIGSYSYLILPSSGS
tara:strand:- start:5943 stop:6821 length:879 start_codon:yes stop_codon:yes gene_type:complete